MDLFVLVVVLHGALLVVDLFVVGIFVIDLLSWILTL